MRRYSVSRREPIVRFITAALERGGARIVSPPDPSRAPFEIAIRTPAGEDLELICYAFLANKYRQRNRPSDEHRFQVKYGSDFRGYHRLYIATSPNRVTLMFGVHLEEGLFIACDPAMHEWTRFSRSIEFKTHHVKRARASGWLAWERDRSQGRRHAPPPIEDARTEVLLAFQPERFLQYVAFEQVASGMDAGERLLLADKIGSTPAPPQALVHPMERELGLSAHQILDMIGGAFRLKAAVRGSAAEHHLGEYLRSVPGVTKVRAIDEDGRPDFEVVVRRRAILIECKNVLRRLTTAGLPRVDFQKTRASKKDPCSRYYKPTQFDVLAACLHPITERWEYRFASTATLPSHPRCPGHLSSQVTVSPSGWHESLGVLL